MRARNVDVYACDRAEPLNIRFTGSHGHHVTAVTDGVLELEATPAGMARGKAFEQQVRDALGL